MSCIARFFASVILILFYGFCNTSYAQTEAVSASSAYNPTIIGDFLALDKNLSLPDRKLNIWVTSDDGHFRDGFISEQNKGHYYYNTIGIEHNCSPHVILGAFFPYNKITYKSFTNIKNNQEYKEGGGAGYITFIFNKNMGFNAYVGALWANDNTNFEDMLFYTQSGTKYMTGASMYLSTTQGKIFENWRLGVDYNNLLYGSFVDSLGFENSSDRQEYNNINFGADIGYSCKYMAPFILGYVAGYTKFPRFFSNIDNSIVHRNRGLYTYGAGMMFYPIKQFFGLIAYKHFAGISGYKADGVRLSLSYKF